ncbi:neutral zinc metallopeptidase [Granulicella cerasi]|uniref:Neutral zinc metallopeptidase n=1 Tax=Granulicella cerasi TaxID=741063 RepID=A0ABW1Z7V1_9BACT|nr:neutral zinc metallopeptidase [Granulicella cerasi]
MDWQSGDMSSDVEDRRGESGGGGGGFGFGGGGLGIVGFLVLLVISAVTGRNFIGGYLHGGGGSSAPVAQRARTPESSQAEDRDAHLISWTLDDVQKTWTQIFEQKGKTYRHAKLVMFRDQTYSGCGTAESSTGPFYCPADQKVYIDLGFWDELKKFGGSTADFAQAYVVGHELGHHVQNLLGTESKVQRLMQEEPSEKNHLSVDLELQADCYAGVWGHSLQQRGKINADDVKSALSAAAAVGDDHLQKMSGRAVSPESWTHGSSAQRETWFKRGFESGDPGQCNTFGGKSSN